jgi:hypothetical protein
LEPYATTNHQIADLTYTMRQLLDQVHTAKTLSVRGMLEMKTSGMAWSESVPLSSEQGQSGGVLAIANRAGMVALWV